MDNKNIPISKQIEYDVARLSGNTIGQIAFEYGMAAMPALSSEIIKNIVGESPVSHFLIGKDQSAIAVFENTKGRDLYKTLDLNESSVVLNELYKRADDILNSDDITSKLKKVFYGDDAKHILEELGNVSFEPKIQIPNTSLNQSKPAP